ncbi:MAG: YHYH protein [Sandaracinaceae bacterium]|nr:YHYH protein [Sandaracinaceae bacterium]MBK7779097.1 YHYH protein [Sandaracinaceae bacterium]MBK8589461.1 YHYH protein [Sandaracinaceae bacterium]
MNRITTSARISPLVALAALLGACGGAGDGMTDLDGGTLDQGGALDEGIPTSTACTELLTRVGEAYTLSGALRDCSTVSGGAAVADSLMNLDGITIDNEGTAMTPCIAVLCDDDAAYVASNALPHYDFVATTPNALVENAFIYRVPLTPAPFASNAGATDAASINGCATAYTQYLTAPTVATQNEPSGLCARGAATLISDTEDGVTHVYQQIPCLNTTGFVISGSPVFGPNEAGVPDPFGNPGYNYPNDTSDDYGNGAALDFCGGHTANAMHYHAAIDACFERDSSGAPANSYAGATAGWDLAASMTDACSEPSGVVGWSPDGYPIMGSCVCVARDDAGACTEVRRARSGWAYNGLGVWGADAGEAAALGVEGSSCTTDDDCCTGADCNFSCSVTVVPTSVGTNTEVGRRCVLVDYAWCTHQYVRRDEKLPAGEDYVYLDRCNGFEGPDGYAYYATLTFPYLTGCLRGAADDYVADLGDGGMNMNGLPMCTVGQTMCCGDDICGGPETAQNCAADCP